MPDIRDLTDAAALIQKWAPPPRRRPANPTINRVGQIVREHRERKGLTQYALAQIAAAPDNSSISLIESGKRVPGRVMTEGLIEALDISDGDAFRLLCHFEAIKQIEERRGE